METFYLILAGVWCASILILVAHARYKATLEEYRYRLFECRDRLFLLVAKGELSEDSLLFEETSRMINTLIPKVEKFTLKLFVKSYLRADERNFSDEARTERFLNELSAAPAPVRNVITDFFRAVMMILHDSSILLRVILRLRFLFDRNHNPFKKILATNAPSVYKAYRTTERRLNLFGKAGHQFA